MDVQENHIPQRLTTEQQAVFPAHRKRKHRVYFDVDHDKAQVWQVPVGHRVITPISNALHIVNEQEKEVER